MILPFLNAATLPAGPVVRMLFLQRSTVHLHPRPQGAFFVRAREFVRGPHRIRSSRSVLIMLPNRVAARGFPYTISTLTTHPAKWKFLRLHRPDDSSPGNGLSTPPPAHAVSLHDYSMCRPGAPTTLSIFFHAPSCRPVPA